MTSVPRWEPDGTESPAERTDPLLPAITDDMLPPVDLPRLPMLDDRTLAQMLAELDGDAAGPGEDGGSGEELAVRSDPSATGDPTADPAEPARPRAVADAPPTGDPSTSRTARTARTVRDENELPLRLVEHPAASETRGRTSAGVWPAKSTGKYVRRDLRPPEVHADALSLTGLTRRSRSRVGSILFTVVFAGIFLLILVQAIVSLLTPGS